MGLPIIRKIVSWSKTHSLPGFFGVPLYDVFVFVGSELRRHSLMMRANSMAFSFFLAIFPSLMGLFTLIPYFKQYIFRFLPQTGQSFSEILTNEILQILPGNAGLALSGFIQDLVVRPRVGLLSLGFFLAIFFASNGMLNMMRSFEKSHKTTFMRRNGFRKRILAILLTFQLGLMVIAAVVLIILGNTLLGIIDSYLHLDKVMTFAISMLRWLIILSLFYTVISVIYRYGAPMRRKVNFWTPGATVAAIGCILSSIVFGLYVDNFSMYNELYGSFGTIIVTMLWIQINCFMLLIGFELNASIAVNRDLKLAAMTEAEHTQDDSCPK